jgi:Holliday junction resolvasome RuvABC DNA-binding subunit
MGRRIGEPNAVGAEVTMDAIDALTRMGFKSRESRNAIAAAVDDLGADLALERLVFEALRRCRRAQS